jgi:rod shape-determining protein MreD
LFALAAASVRLFDARHGYQPQLFEWRQVAIVATLFELGAWQLMALAGQPIPLPPLGWQLLTTIAAYPLVVALCAVVQRRSFGRGLVG